MNRSALRIGVLIAVALIVLVLVAGQLGLDLPGAKESTVGLADLRLLFPVRP